MDGTWGTVNYLAPGSVRNRLYIAPGNQRATARYAPHRVFIATGRAQRDDLTLDAAGFTLVDHRTSVRILDDPAVLDGGYTGEALALVRVLTRADYVVSLGWLLRRTAADRGGALPPAPDVHVDLHSTEIAHRYARVHARGPLPKLGNLPARRVDQPVARVLTAAAGLPPAPCDYRSTDDAEDGTPNLLFRVLALPDPGEPDAPDEDAESAASLFRASPAHRWWYFPGMHRAEALLIKLHDTDHTVAWRAPHTSFHDTAAAGLRQPARVGRTAHGRLLPLTREFAVE